MNIEILSSYFLALPMMSPSVAQTSQQIQWSEDRSFVNTQHQIYLLQCLRDIVKEFAEVDTPIPSATIEHAKEVIRRLPFTIMPPEINAFLSGKIVFEWYLDQSHQAVISVSEQNAVAYSSLLGNQRFVCWQQLSLIGDLIEKIRLEFSSDVLL